MPLGDIRLAVAARLLRQLAEILGDHRAQRRATHCLQPPRGGDGLFPVALLLVDGHQARQRTLEKQILVCKLTKQAFGAIEHARTQIILCKLVACLVAVCCLEIGARDQVLVHAQGTVDLALPTEQVAEREMGFGRVVVDFEHAHEGGDRLVGVVVDQLAYAAQVVRIDRRRRFIVALRSSAYVPARRCRKRQQGQNDPPDAVKHRG